MQSHRYCSRTLSSGLVMISAICLFVDICALSTVPSVTFSLMKKFFMSICLVRRWNSGFCASLTAALLSTCNTGTYFSVIWRDSNSLYIKTTSLTVSVAAMISASAMDVATVACRWLSQDMMPPAYITTTPEVERPVVLQLPKSESL